MRTAVTLKSTDLESGEVKILADGPAIWNNRVLLYREKETGARHRISFQEDLVIERTADVHSITTLKENESGEAVVDSPYGSMTLRTECISRKDEEGMYRVEYAVYSGNEQVLHQRLEWTIRQLS